MFFNNFDYYKYKDKVDFCSIEQNVEGLLLMKISNRKQLRKSSTYVLLLKAVNICILASILPNPNEPKQ